MGKFRSKKLISAFTEVGLIVLLTASCLMAGENTQENFSFSRFLKNTFVRSDSEERPSVDSSDNLVESLDQTMDKVVEQRSVLAQSREQKGKLVYDQGVLYYHQFKFSQAEKCFEEALIYLPEDEKSKDYLEKCRQILGVGRQSSSQATQWMGEQQDVVVQELKIKGRFHKEKSDRLLQEAQQLWAQSPGEDLALKKLEEARYEMRRAKAALVQLPAGEDKAGILMQADETISKVDALEVSWKGFINKKIESAAREKSLVLSQEAQAYDGSRLTALLVQARRLYLDGRYQESENLCKIILGEWPKSVDAKLLLSKSISRKNSKLTADLKEKSAEEWHRNIEKVRDASVSYAEWVNYSKDWLEIEKKRTVVSGKEDDEPEWTKMMRQKMEKLVTLHLPDNTLNEAVEMMREQTGVNFNIDRSLDLSGARITELHLNEVRLSAALDLILNNVQTPNDSPLLYQFQDEVVFITTRANQNLFNRPEQVMYDVTDLVTSFGEYGLAEGDGLKSGKPVSGAEEASQTTPLSTDTLSDLIKDSIEPDSWQSEGVALAKYEEGKLLVSHSAEVHAQIVELLDMFRKQQKLQVSIEARFITSTDDDLFDIGVEWKGLDEVSMEDTSTVGAGVYSSRSNSRSDTRVATVLGSAADTVVGGAPLFISENRAAQGFNAELSVLDPIRASIVLHALSRKQTAKNLLAPRLTVINNRQGYFLSSTEESYVRNFSADQGNIIPEIDRVSSGELLVVKPTVSSDRKYITLDLSPQVTRIIGYEQRALSIPVQSNTGNNNSGSTPLQIVNMTIELPNVEIWQLQTRIQVPDGGVVFVGGRMGNIEQKSTRAVPIISKIPLIGRLFRSDGEYVQLDNLIISVQAKILVFDEMESKLH